ncbi:ADP-ribose pyrophosphatase [Alphaproteobacteria bacterium SO-S41]|nr:ADP-ribose pyrophosphatase [Alphaproteobacteria bacterium SO-S41]
MADDEHHAAEDRPAAFSGHRSELLFKAYRSIERHEGIVATAQGPMKVERDVYRIGVAAVIVAYDPARDLVVLQRQFRFPVHLAGLDALIVELPGGIVEPGEAPEAAARREAIEELGVAPTDIIPAFTFLPSPGSLFEEVHLFVARIDACTLPAHAGKRAEAEFTEPFAVSPDAVLAAIDADRLSHGFTIIGMLWFARHRARLRQRWGFDP